MKRNTELLNPSDWKGAIRAHLDAHSTSRYAFIRECHARDICTVHTAECLLADDDTVTGRRIPSLQVALRMADAAGFEVVMRPRRSPASTRRKAEK